MANTEDFSHQKARLRKIFLAQRDRLSLSEREKLSQLIGKYLLAWPPYQRAKRVLFYASFKSEVITYPLIQRALNEGKEVYLPKTYLSPRKLRLFRIFSLEELKPGTYGIPEPSESNSEIDPQALELIIVPGVAFDEKGGRLGYGGGFYDRLFIKAPRAKRVALAFSCQVTEILPLEPHDVRMHALITEKGLKEFL